MADISKIEVNGTQYNVKDTTARSNASAAQTTANGKVTKPVGPGSVPSAVEGITTLEDNHIYASTWTGNVNRVFKGPTNGWAHGTFTHTEPSRSFNVSLASGEKIIGEFPTLIYNTMYEYDVLNGVWIICEVSS